MGSEDFPVIIPEQDDYSSIRSAPPSELALAEKERKMQDIEDRAIQSQEIMRQLLEEHEISHLESKLIEEGFDDMETLLAIERRDFEAMRIREDDARLLQDCLVQYRRQNKLPASTFDLDNFLSKVEQQTREKMDALAKADALIAEADEDSDQGDEDHVAFSSDDDDDGYNSDEGPIPHVTIETMFPGDNENFPQRGEIARVHYIASLDDGTVFESSRKRGFPFEFLVGAGRVVPGWDRAIRRMSLGERSRIVVGPEMAYGETGRTPAIPPNATVTFEVELIDMYSAQVGVLPGEDDDFSDEEDNEF